MILHPHFYEMNVSSMKKPRYIKSGAVKQLEELATAEAHRRHPGNPAVVRRIFRDDSANKLTECIVKYIELCGGFASRINNQGTYNKHLGRYIPSTSKRGLADVMGTYRGKSLHIEVKIGRDKMSEHQEKVRDQVTASGGVYYIARDFESFKAWFDSL